MNKYNYLCPFAGFLSCLIFMGLCVYDTLHPRTPQQAKPDYYHIDTFNTFQTQYKKLTISIYKEVLTACENNKPIKPEWILSLIHEESRFYPFAVSHKKAKGLCQLMPYTARRYNVQDVFNPSENIRGGVAFFAYCLKRAEGDLHAAFMKYHAGPNREAYPENSYEYALKCIANIKKSEEKLF